MATYLVVHTPKTAAELAEDTSVRPPTRLRELAETHGTESSHPRWITTWSPDLHDERLFSLWEANDAQVILTTIDAFGFLDDLVAQPVRVQAWGPTEVLKSDE